MSKDYSVDDILFDVANKKTGDKNKKQKSSQPMDETVMFSLKDENKKETFSKEKSSYNDKTAYFDVQKPFAPKREKNFTKRDILRGFGEGAEVFYEGDEEENHKEKKVKIENSFNFDDNKIATGNGYIGERSFSFGEEAQQMESEEKQEEKTNGVSSELSFSKKPSYASSPESFKLNIDKKLFDDFESEIDEIGESVQTDAFLASEETKEINLPKEDDLPKEEIKKTEDDYRSPMDEEAVSNDIAKIHKGVLVRCVFTGILFLLSFYFTISYKNTAPLPSFMFPTGDTLGAFLWTNTAICFLAMLVNSSTVWTGFLGFFTFKGDSDTLVSFASLASVLQGVAFAASPEAFYESHLDLFFPVSILLLLFNGFGKLLLIGRIKRNFDVIRSKGKKFALMSVRSKSMKSSIDKLIGSPRDKIVYYCRTRWLSGFQALSYTEDPTDDLCRLISPICVLGAILISVASALYTKNVYNGFTAFAVILVLATPITSTIITNLPLFKMSKAVNKDEAIVTGYEAVNEFSKTDTVIVNAPDMFKPENVIIHGIKAFDKSQIENVIIDAASVLTSCYGTLSRAFLQLVNDDRSVLKKVDEVKYIDSCGLSALVDGREVLIGNRRLMIKSGVEVPSIEYEKKYVKDARNIVYLANGGKLSSMFIISYHPDEEFLRKLKAIIDEGIDLCVYTIDPNITSEMVADTIKVPRDYVTVMPSKIHGIYQQNTKIRKEIPAKIGFVGGIGGMLHTITASIKAKAAISRGISFQLGFLMVGYLAGAAFSFMGRLSLVSFWMVIVFHLITLLVCYFASNFRE